MKKIIFTCIFLMSVGFAMAQVTTSNIKGLILDKSAQPLMGANILAIHTPTGTKYGAATNEDGRFNLLNLRVGGPYSITISYIGYKAQTFNDVYLDLGKTLSLDIAMISELELLVVTEQAQKLMWEDVN